jgi:hypothetical protein
MSSNTAPLLPITSPLLLHFIPCRGAFPEVIFLETLAKDSTTDSGARILGRVRNNRSLGTIHTYVVRTYY